MDKLFELAEKRTELGYEKLVTDKEALDDQTEVSRNHEENVEQELKEGRTELKREMMRDKSSVLGGAVSDRRKDLVRAAKESERGHGERSRSLLPLGTSKML